MFKKTLGMLALSAAFLAGCGNDGNEVAENGNGNGEAVEESASGRGAMENFTVGTPFRATEPIEVSLLFRELPSSPFQNDWMVLDKIREATNVTFNDVIHVMNDDFGEQRSLLISAGNAPEIMPFVWGQYIPALAAGGALLPIGDYFDYMPNFTHFATEWDLWDDIENLRQANGNIYMLPGLQEDTRVRFTVVMRQDILDELGLDVPDSWEEIRDVLRVVAEERPDMIPYSPRWDLDATLNHAARTWGVRAGWGMGNGLMFDHDTNEFMHIAQMDEFRDFVEFWASLMEEELLHPEALTQGCGPAVEHFINGEAFMTDSGHSILEYHTNIQELIATGEADHMEGYTLVQLPIPNGPKGWIGEQRIDNGIILNASIAERPDFHAILQFIDWLWFSEEGRELTMWGVEGETFFINEDGDRELMPGFQHRAQQLNTVNEDGELNEDYADIQVDHGFMENVFSLTGGGSRDLLMSVMNEEGRWAHERNAERPSAPLNPGPALTLEEQEMFSMMQASIQTHTNQNLALFIAGQRSMDEWDDFVSELNAMQLQEYVNLANETVGRD